MPFEVAQKYCQQINYKLNNKDYVGIGFKNDSVGFEILTLIQHVSKGYNLDGYIAVCFSSGFLVKWSMRKRWFVWLSQFSFVIFGLYAPPLVAYAINAVLPLVSKIDNHRFLIYALLPMGLFIFCIAMGALIRGVFPGLFKILTGGRGI